MNLTGKFNLLCDEINCIGYDSTQESHSTFTVTRYMFPPVHKSTSHHIYLCLVYLVLLKVLYKPNKVIQNTLISLLNEMKHLSFFIYNIELGFICIYVHICNESDKSSKFCIMSF